MQKIIRINAKGVNCYLIQNQDKFILVDTGGPLFMDGAFYNHRDLVCQGLDDAGVTKDNLALILLTHGDSDHVFNAAYLHQKYGAPIAMHAADVDMVENNQRDTYLINTNFSSPLFQIGFKLISSKIQKLMDKVHENFEGFTPDCLLADGDTLDSVGFDGVIYHMPGHTPGSICILTSEGDFICGDLMANNKKPTMAPNAQDYSLLKKQLDKISKLPINMIYPGHGEPFASL